MQKHVGASWDPACAWWPLALYDAKLYGVCCPRVSSCQQHPIVCLRRHQAIPTASCMLGKHSWYISPKLIVPLPGSMCLSTFLVTLATLATMHLHPLQPQPCGPCVCLSTFCDLPSLPHRVASMSFILRYNLISISLPIATDRMHAFMEKLQPCRLNQWGGRTTDPQRK